MMNNKIPEIGLWEMFEVTLEGPKRGNPFLEVELKAIFTHESGETLEIEGFYNDNGIYKIRFMPVKKGHWRYVTKSNVEELDGQKGEFICVDPSPGNHGPVRVHNKYHFAYADGTPYIPFGTTLYAWIYQSPTLIKQTLDTLRKSPFNKVRMCVFPKYYAYNREEPEMYPFKGSTSEGFDFSWFNVSFFEHLERQIENLMKLGIEADLILFHPYDRWGFSNMGFENDIRYLRYVVARLSAYRNVWWSLANEYDFLESKTLEDWDRYFQLIQEKDPYNHLRSIHCGITFYDYSKPWVTHASIQWQGSLRFWGGDNWGEKKVLEWRKRYGKPIIVDECGYEGDIEFGWGNLTPQEMVNRIWEGVTAGGYVTHGETYYREDEVLWWSKGGRLHGQSPERIAFLKKIIDEAPDYLEPIYIDWDVSCIGKEKDYYLIYFDVNRPRFRELTLPKGGSYKIEVIDAWNMTIDLVGTFKGNCRIELPGKSYMALRITRV